ncbi:MAG: AMP-binding protein, partial [Anderseniella sp.]
MNATGIHPPEGTVRSWLDSRARENGSETSHVFPDEADLTWAELRHEAEEIAYQLAGLGVSKGESVALMMPNSRQGILCLFGALYGGFRTAVINLVAGTEAISYALSHSEAKFVFLGEGQSPLLDNVRAMGSFSAIPIPVGKQIQWPRTGAKGALEGLSPDDHAILMYTSGTTGRPKGVVHSHASLLAGGWTSATAHELTSSDRAMCVLPIYHINGLCVTIMAPLVSGGSVIVCEKFSASRFWSICKEFEATWFSVVPTIISHLLHGDHNPDEHTIAKIRFGRSASSALAVETQIAFETRFGIPIVETMGLTETAAQILSNPLPPGLRKIGSPGKAYGNDVAILGPDLSPLPIDIEGEIAVRGPNVMHGYFKNREATVAALT